MELYCAYIIEVGSKETIHCNMYISTPVFNVFCEKDTGWIYLFICLFIYFLFICLFICLFIYLLFVCLFFVYFLFIYLFIFCLFLFICLFIYLFIFVYLFVYLFICLFVYLFICVRVQDLTVPMHLGLNWQALCAPYQFMWALFLY